MEMNTDIQQYLDVIKRRKFHFILPGVLVFLVVAAIAFILPPTYKSTATIQIEAQEIPKDLVRTTVTGYVEERLQTISGIVLSQVNLVDVIDRFGLYQELRDEHTMGEIVGIMRQAIEVQPITKKVLTGRSGSPVPVTVAFTLSYEGKEPQKLPQVVNYLSSLFLEENVKDREKKADATMEFLENQIEELSASIQQLEAKIANYKEKHITELPELMQLNLRTMDRLEREVEAKEQNTRYLINRKSYLEAQLTLLEPTFATQSSDGKRPLTPEEELEVLRSQYLNLSASVSEQHPDLINLKKKIEAMKRELNAREDLGQRSRELQEKENQLALMLEEHTEKYPDAIRLKTEIVRLRKQIQSTSEKQPMLKVEDEKPDNPGYINLQTQIASTQMEIETSQKEISLLKQKYEYYRKRVENTPRVEQKYLDLKRNYRNAKEKYHETMNRLLAAKEAKVLEESRKGESFTLTEEAVTPNKPYKPNRLALLLLGMVLATGSGLGYGSVAEFLDRSVHLPEELAKITGSTVLAVIPYLETSQDRSRKRWRRLAFVGSTIGLVVIGLVVLHFFYRPLDIRWLK